MPNSRKKRALTVLAPRHLAEQLRCFVDGGVAFHRVERAQLSATHAEHLMENAVAFERQRRGRKIAGNLRAVFTSILICAVAAHDGNSRRYAAGCLDTRDRMHESIRAFATAGFDAQCA